MNKGCDTFRLVQKLLTELDGTNLLAWRTTCQWTWRLSMLPLIEAAHGFINYYGMNVLEQGPTSLAKNYLLNQWKSWSKRQMPKIITYFYYNLRFLLGHWFDSRGIPRASSISLNETLVLYGSEKNGVRWRFEYCTFVECILYILLAIRH